MFTDLIDDDDWPDRDDDWRDSNDGLFCKHGQRFNECETCDAGVGDIDKCLECGRYRSTSSLNSSQCCKAGCTNPNEY